MLAYEVGPVGRCRLSTSDALELVQVLVEDLARDSVNLCIDCAVCEAVALDCDLLASSQVALLFGYLIDHSHCLSLVAVSIIVAAAVHGGIHVLGKAYAELEVYLTGVSRDDVSHPASYLIGNISI